MEVKSFKDMDGKTVTIGDNVKRVDLDGNCGEVKKVKRITKEGYFISVYLEGQNYAWYQPKTCLRKVDTA